MRFWQFVTVTPRSWYAEAFERFATKYGSRPRAFEELVRHKLLSDDKELKKAVAAEEQLVNGNKQRGQGRKKL